MIEIKEVDKIEKVPGVGDKPKPVPLNPQQGDTPPEDKGFKDILDKAKERAAEKDKKDKPEADSEELAVEEDKT